MFNSMYGRHGRVTATRGRVHDYLGMELDYQKRGGELKINMTKYVENMLNDFPVKLGKREERRGENASQRQTI
jgi:hypothetical protein